MQESLYICTLSDSKDKVHDFQAKYSEFRITV